jgi:hypothetical protein
VVNVVAALAIPELAQTQRFGWMCCVCLGIVQTG